MDANEWFEKVYVPRSLEYAHQNETYAERIMFAYQSGRESAAAELAALRAELERAKKEADAHARTVGALVEQRNKAENESNRLRAMVFGSYGWVQMTETPTPEPSSNG